MHVRYTTGCQLCYKNHIVNLPQDITEIADRLPRLPQGLDLLIIREQDDAAQMTVPDIKTETSLLAESPTEPSPSVSGPALLLVVVDGPACNQQGVKGGIVGCIERTLTLLRLVEHRMHSHTREGVREGRWSGRRSLA
jgi:hypothetical protein